MEFKSRFEIDDIVYFYDNDRTNMFNSDGYIKPRGIFILEGQITRIIVDYVKYQTIKQPFITYKVRVGDSITIDVHEDFVALSIDELAEQSKKYWVSKLTRR